MASREPDGEHVHAAGERDDGVVGDAEHDKAWAAQPDEPAPNQHQSNRVRQHWIAFTLLTCLLRMWESKGPRQSAPKLGRNRRVHCDCLLEAKSLSRVVYA